MPNTKEGRSSRFPIHARDLHGLTRLGFDAAVGVTQLVENLHETIASVAPPLGAQRLQATRGITGLVYRTVLRGTRLAGRGAATLSALLGLLQQVRESTPEREAMLAVLNGVFGDHLVRSANPLAIPMSLRVGGQTLSLDTASIRQRVVNPGPRLVVLIHGLCMNDLQWLRQGHDHGQALAADLGCNAVYLHYNTGRHVSDNGHDLAALLDALVAAWPVPLNDLILVGHSMGGLVARSACHVAGPQSAWLPRVRKMVFLGTPHHGAPLERGGQLLDTVLGLSPYLAPFSRLGKARSAGITDLRFGNVQDADRHGRDRHSQKKDDRRSTPLPAGIQTYLVAAVRAAKADDPRNAVIGDGLVPLNSALGKHRRASLNLAVPPSHQFVVTKANHWDLLSREDVYQRMHAWLQDAGSVV